MGLVRMLARGRGLGNFGKNQLQALPLLTINLTLIGNIQVRTLPNCLTCTFPSAVEITVFKSIAYKKASVHLPYSLPTQVRQKAASQLGFRRSFPNLPNPRTVPPENAPQKWGQV